MRTRTIGLLVIALGIALLRVSAADAGCGCSKPPPPIAPIRPSVAYPGAPVTLFSPALVEGSSYTVTFTSGTATASATVGGDAVLLRDLADGVLRLQLVVELPSLPPGPTSVSVRTLQDVEVLALDDFQLTVAPPPLPIPHGRGAWHFPDARAAVGRNGVVYVALDLSSLTDALIFRAQAIGYPLRFLAEDAVFYNRQGFLMQLLVQNDPLKGTPVPGMFVLPAQTPESDSDILNYSRHEFVTYFLQHQERQPHAVDPSDGNWHLDGTPHVDHDHLILAIAGRLQDGSVPPAGITPPFDLKLKAFSPFHAGLVGTENVEMGDQARVDSYEPEKSKSKTGSNGRVYSKGLLTLNDHATVLGDAAAAAFAIAPGTTITGSQTVLSDEPVTFMGVLVPPGIPELGPITLAGTTRMIVGPGTFAVDTLEIGKHGLLFIDNSAGPVTLYVRGSVTLAKGGAIEVTDSDAEKFAIYVAGAAPVMLAGDGKEFHGVVYAPRSRIAITESAELSGAVVGRDLHVDRQARLHYDATLRTPDDASPPDGGPQEDDDLPPPAQNCVATGVSAHANKPFNFKLRCDNPSADARTVYVTSIAPGSCAVVRSVATTIKPGRTRTFNVKLRCREVGVPFTVFDGAQ